jgi:hypothetical protein
MLVIGLVLSLIFLGIKAATVYMAKHGPEGEDGEDEESEPNKD